MARREPGGIDQHAFRLFPAPFHPLPERLTFALSIRPNVEDKSGDVSRFAVVHLIEAVVRLAIIVGNPMPAFPADVLHLDLGADRRDCQEKQTCYESRMQGAAHHRSVN